MTWTVRIHTIPEHKREALIKYCQEAQEHDPTFKFVIRKGVGIIIDCPDKDTAYKRGVLLHHRFDVFFEVEWRKE